MNEFENEGRRLVPAAIRGYRQFRVYCYRWGGDGISSLNHTRWSNGKLDAHCPAVKTVLVPVTRLPSYNSSPFPESDSAIVVRSELRSHPAPTSGCTCGIYALGFPAQWVRPRFVFNGEGELDHAILSGVVSCSGKTVLGELGFRTQRAEIEAITLPQELWRESGPVLALLERELGSAKVYADHSKMYRDHPCTSLRDLYDNDRLARINEARSAYYIERPAPVGAGIPSNARVVGPQRMETGGF